MAIDPEVSRGLKPPESAFLPALKRQGFQPSHTPSVMYNVATNQQQGLGTSLSSLGCFSSTDSTNKRKHTGSMKQLGQKKRRKSQLIAGTGDLETPSSYEVG